MLQPSLLLLLCDLSFMTCFAPFWSLISGFCLWCMIHLCLTLFASGLTLVVFWLSHHVCLWYWPLLVLWIQQLLFVLWYPVCLIIWPFACSLGFCISLCLCIFTWTVIKYVVSTLAFFLHLFPDRLLCWHECRGLGQSLQITPCRSLLHRSLHKFKTYLIKCNGSPSSYPTHTSLQLLHLKTHPGRLNLKNMMGIQPTVEAFSSSADYTLMLQEDIPPK